MKILLIDNYDSFTYNIVQALGAMGHTVDVYRNDAITPDEVERSGCDRLVISPGPCTPREAGVSCAAIERMKDRVPVLGVCLGHQCFGHVFGAVVGRAARLMHGKTSMIHHDGKGVFKGLPNPFEATRYHSLVVYEETLPPFLEVSAWTEDVTPREVMGLRHRTLSIEGVQFHPESYLTASGVDLLRNFLDHPWRPNGLASAPARR